MKAFFRKKSGYYGKITIAIVLITLAGLIHFLQASGWHRAVKLDFKLKDILLLFTGYYLLALFSPLVFWLHSKFGLRNGKLGNRLILHTAFSLTTSLLHNLTYAIVYFLIFPAWQEYGFLPLFQDIFYNYFNIGILFYWGIIVFSEAYDSFVLKDSWPKQGLTQTLHVKDGRSTHLVNMAEIKYIRSADNYVEVHVKEKPLLMRQSLSKLEKQLDPGTFLRVHRTAIVNRHFISALKRTPNGEFELVMSDDVTLPMSRHRKEVREMLLLTAQA